MIRYYWIRLKMKYHYYVTQDMDKWEKLRKRKIKSKYFLKKKDMPRIKIRSNVIQFDEMGYPLRLCIFTDGEQHWVDTYEKDGDVILKWEEE